MTVGDCIQLIGIIISAILGVLSLIVGICNYRSIKVVKQLIIHSENNDFHTTKQRSKADHGSTTIQVGGDFHNE